LVLGLLGGVTPIRVAAETVTLKFHTAWAEYSLTFDPNVISVEEVKRLSQISPYDFYACSKPDLEYCVTGACDFGLRTGWRAPNYFKNAEINIEKAKQQLDFLQNLRYPTELRPWVQYLVRFWTFNVWLEETRLDFYRTWDVATLKQKHEGLNPTEVCADSITSIQAAGSDHDTQYMLLKFRWGTCVTEKYQSEIGMNSSGTWGTFLQTFHITEKVKTLEEDND